jgi:hypothetical protein
MALIIKWKHINDPFKSFRLININNITFFDLRNFYASVSNYIVINKYYKYLYHTFFNYWLSLMWRGKAYRVRFFKKHKKFTLNFGYSHWTKLIYNEQLVQFFKRKRQKYYIFFKYFFQQSELKFFLNNIKKMNKYTNRGFRVKNSVRYRRFGKISQGNLSLHSY